MAEGGEGPSRDRVVPAPPFDRSPTERRRRVGQYEIIRRIGHGGMAAVYLARQATLDRDVALKELSTFHSEQPEMAHRFLRESRLAGALNHPSIVTVHEYLEEEGVPYIAMEYVPRGSLRPYVGKFSLSQLSGVMEGVLAGLAYAQSLGIVHRDLKPENLMVTDEGRVKIADFGIAKATQQTLASSFVTATGSVVGTPSYMAPEQAMGQGVGAWTDLYSVGVMAWEQVVGRLPFHDSGSPMAILMRHVTEEIPSATEINPDVDPGLARWIDRLLVKDPARRTQDATEAWEELEEITIARYGALWRRDARLPSHSETGSPPPSVSTGRSQGSRAQTSGPASPSDELATEEPTQTSEPRAPDGPAPPAESSARATPVYASQTQAPAAAGPASLLRSAVLPVVPAREPTAQEEQPEGHGGERRSPGGHPVPAGDEFRTGAAAPVSADPRSITLSPSSADDLDPGVADGPGQRTPPVAQEPTTNPVSGATPRITDVEQESPSSAETVLSRSARDRNAEPDRSEATEPDSEAKPASHSTDARRSDSFAEATLVKAQPRTKSLALGIKPADGRRSRPRVLLVAAVAAVAVAAAIYVSIGGPGGAVRKPPRATSAAHSTPFSSTSSASTTSSSSSSAGASAAAGKALFTGQAGCGGCHTLAAAGTSGTVGPNLTQRLASDCRLPASKTVRGASLTQCVTTAIVHPYAYIPSGFIAGVMPSTFSQTLSKTQIQSLVSFLVSVTK